MTTENQIKCEVVKIRVEARERKIDLKWAFENNQELKLLDEGIDDELVKAIQTSLIEEIASYNQAGKMFCEAMDEEIIEDLFRSNHSTKPSSELYFVEGALYRLQPNASCMVCPYEKMTTEYNEWQRGYSWMCMILE